MEKLCVIKIRSDIKSKGSERKILQALGLKKQNMCAVIDKNDVNLGAVEKVEGYVTYGEINKDMLKKLIKKYSKVQMKDSDIDTFIEDFYANNKSFKDIGLSHIFRLHPPRGGFERKGKKVPFKSGGAVGYRADKINELLSRMI